MDSAPFAFSTMSVLGHGSIYSSSLVLRLYGLNQPGNQIEGDVREAWPLSLSLWRVFSVKMAPPRPVLLLTSFSLIDVLRCQECCWCPALLLCCWRSGCCVNVPCRLLCDDLYASDVLDYWWRSFCSWRPELLLTSKIASAISCMFLLWTCLQDNFWCPVRQ